MTARRNSKALGKELNVELLVYFSGIPAIATPKSKGNEGVIDILIPSLRS
ncbi:hypothetical protein Pyrfu_0763 [Pyrolobus fumarii 1A]|uniref:Uncharacterized protein n=1 Tax=Pyrolobus fumarii (strain DSM 11204 / 1A) TaxID=694429 RepID=G0EDE7_PYRF1|nr:hypothetical protein Pyrfu_0763 [Pyrolobus fumarii 1A]